MRAYSIPVLLLSALVVFSTCESEPAGATTERPNILWLTCEDISPYAFGAYGNPNVRTPNIDSLAARGIRFTRASSVSPYCSPARSTIISGQYAHRYGNDWHREGRALPADRYFFPRLLREAGYFTTNIGKEDYNVDKELWADYHEKVWDARQEGGTYNHPGRAEGQPFFSVFNNMSTHMSRLTSVTTAGREQRRIDPGEVRLPPHVPDATAVRDDYAWHLDRAEEVDEWVGHFLADLDRRGLADNTIIFFYSDHGGSLPRGKAYPTTTGLEVPLIVYAPPKYAHLLPGQAGSTDNRLVDFTDLAPTVLGLAGATVPDYLDGQDFLKGGKQKPLQYGVRCNSAHVYNPSRTVRDERYLLVRHFTPYLPHGLRQEFQWRMPGQLAYDSLFFAGALGELHGEYYLPRPAVQLYDLANDPYQRFDLADRPEQRERVNRLSDSILAFSHRTEDMGFLPRSARQDLAKRYGSVWVAGQGDYPLSELIEAAYLASDPDPEQQDTLIELLLHPEAAIRYWGAVGFANLASAGVITRLPNAARPFLEDEDEAVATTLATAMVLAGGSDRRVGLATLRDYLDRGSLLAMMAAETLGDRAVPLAPVLQQQAGSEELLPRYYATSALINQGRAAHADLYADRLDELQRLWGELIEAGAPLP